MNAVLLRELEKLRGGAIERLRMKYREVFGAEPRSKHKQQLFRQLAWRMRALAEGELSERARRRADEIGRDADLRTLPPREWLATGLIATPRAGVRLEVSRHDRRIPVAGTRLSRDYRGNPVVVQVLAEGFEYEGRQYGSLSAIASVNFPNAAVRAWPPLEHVKGKGSSRHSSSVMPLLSIPP